MAHALHMSAARMPRIHAKRSASSLDRKSTSERADMHEVQTDAAHVMHWWTSTGDECPQLAHMCS